MANTENNDKRVAREARTVEPATNIPQEGQNEVKVGHVYKEKGAEGDNTVLQEVIPYFVDPHVAQVQFSNVGRSNEERMRTSDFLNRFEHIGEVNASSVAEKQVERPDNKKDTPRL